MIDTTGLCGMSVCAFRVSYHVCTNRSSLLIILPSFAHHLVTGVAPSPNAPAAPTHASADGKLTCVCSLQMAVCVRERVGFGGGNHGDGRRRREHKALCLLTLPLFPPPVRYASSVSGPKDVVLVLDRSGSMNAKISKAPGQTKSRITAAKDAANWVINTLSYVLYLVIGVVLSSVEGDSGRSIARQRSYRVIPSSSTDRVSFRLFLPPSPPSSLLLSLFFYPRPPSHSSDHSGTLTTPPL